MSKRRKRGSAWKAKDILNLVEQEGFEKVWKESTKLIPEPTHRIQLVDVKPGEAHPLYEAMQRLRSIFLQLGFTEVSNPIIVDESEVYKQYGSEAPIILDRCYYLAVLPRPDIGLGKAKIKAMEEIGVKMTKEKEKLLKKVFRLYKRGDVEPDDLVQEVARALGASEIMAGEVLSKVFPEFKALKPEPTTLTLRSHMTSAWFLTLQALRHKAILPLKLFSVDVRFRREQREDPTHLRSHRAASCVVMDYDLDVQDGEAITRALLNPLGIRELKFARKEVTSRYYTPGTEYEGFAYNPKTGEWIEVVNYGLYNPIALSRYGLEYPVLNVGIGVERVVMILEGESDVRRLVYPQFYSELTLTDAEIAEMIDLIEKPETLAGREIMKAIASSSFEKREMKAPCEVLCYEGILRNKKVKVYVYETDEGTKLLGPAALNRIYVYQGNILGVPDRGLEKSRMVREAREGGVDTGYRILEAVAAMAARRIEEAVRSGASEVNLRIKMAKNPSDVNIMINDVAWRYITGNNKRIDLQGPVFIGIKAKIER